MTPLFFSGESAVFYGSLLLGFSFGLLFEVTRFIRLAFPHGTAMIFLEDFLFFLPVTFFTLLFLFCFSDGVIRWYILAGIFLGFLIYLKTLGRLLLFFANAILSFLRAVLSFLRRKIFSPIYLFFKKTFKFIFTFVHKFAIIIKRKLIFLQIRKNRRRLLKKVRRGSYK